jgi:hypothetical protein
MLIPSAPAQTTPSSPSTTKPNPAPHSPSPQPPQPLLLPTAAPSSQPQTQQPPYQSQTTPPPHRPSQVPRNKTSTYSPHSPSPQFSIQDTSPKTSIRGYCVSLVHRERAGVLLALRGAGGSWIALRRFRRGGWRGGFRGGIFARLGWRLRFAFRIFRRVLFVRSGRGSARLLLGWRFGRGGCGGFLCEGWDVSTFVLFFCGLFVHQLIWVLVTYLRVRLRSCERRCALRGRVCGRAR